MLITLLIITLVTFSSSLFLLSKQTKGLFIILVSLRLKATLATQVALRLLEKSLIIIIALK